MTYIAQWKRNGGHHPSKPDNTVEIPDEDIENFHTVGDVVNYLEERI